CQPQFCSEAISHSSNSPRLSLHLSLILLRYFLDAPLVNYYKTTMTKLRSLVLAAFLFVGLALASSYAQVDISVNFAPPVLPVYEQPPCPVGGYIWTPGYWGYGYDVGDYYWVPGAWVPPPTVGLLW